MARLPLEVMLNIASSITDITALLAMRLVCREWAEAANTELESWAYLSIYDLDAFDEKFSHLKSRRRVTDVSIIVPDADVDLIPRLREQVLHKLHRFHNLFRLTFNIRPIKDADSSLESKDSAVATSLKVLAQSLLKMTWKRLSYRQLKELSVQGIPMSQGDPHARDNPNAAFGPQALNRIIKLLRITTLDVGLVNHIAWQPQSANYHLSNGDHPIIWAIGAAATLQHLSISCWGFYMKNITGGGFSGMSLPRLQTLRLRGCAFTSDLQLRWLLRHPQLRSLTLDDCTLVYKLTLKEFNFVKEACDSVCLGIENNEAVQFYDTLWSYYFERFMEMPHLRYFAIGSSRVRRPGEKGPSFELESTNPPAIREAKFLFGLFPDRYLHMRDGTPCCPWVLQKPTKKMAPRVSHTIQEDRADRSALLRLLGFLHQSVKQNDVSDHAGYVERLIGKVKSEDTLMKEANTRLQC